MTDTACPKIATQHTDMDLHLQALPQRQTEAYRVWRLVQIVIKSVHEQIKIKKDLSSLLLS